MYETFVEDEETCRFVTLDEMLTSLRYFAKNDKTFCNVYRNLNAAKYKNDLRLEDSPDTGQSNLKRARELAVENPCLMLLQEKGVNAGWNDRAFWWPVLVAPKNVPKTIYASKTISEKVVVTTWEDIS